MFERKRGGSQYRFTLICSPLHSRLKMGSEVELGLVLIFMPMSDQIAKLSQEAAELRDIMTMLDEAIEDREHHCTVQYFIDTLAEGRDILVQYISKQTEAGARVTEVLQAVTAATEALQQYPTDPTGEKTGDGFSEVIDLLFEAAQRKSDEAAALEKGRQEAIKQHLIERDTTTREYANSIAENSLNPRRLISAVSTTSTTLKGFNDEQILADFENLVTTPGRVSKRGRGVEEYSEVEGVVKKSKTE
jgi:hypothetical protein